MKIVNIRTISEHYRILGITFGCSLDELKKARKRLYSKFHPDRYAHMSEAEQTEMKETLQRVQHSYDFIIQNYNLIMETIDTMDSFHLTMRQHRSARSHWTYMQVRGIDDE